jgi:hypothetical protein
MGLGKGKRIAVSSGRLCAEADEENFLFVNDSSRRLLSRRAPRWNWGA